MLPEGTRLPSVRQMAASSGVSKNTVERVYAELKDEGVIAVRPGSGFWVAERPPVICPPEIGAIAAEDSHVKMPITSAAKEAADALPFFRRHTSWPLSCRCSVMDIFPDHLLVHQKTELLIDRHQIGEILPSSRRHKLHAVHIRLHAVKVAGAKFQVA